MAIRPSTWHQRLLEHIHDFAASAGIAKGSGNVAYIRFRGDWLFLPEDFSLARVREHKTKVERNFGEEVFRSTR